MKFLQLSFLLILLNSPIWCQLASWSLTTDGTPTIIDINVTAGIFKKGTGLNTLSFTSNGASCSGWTTSTIPDTADYFQVFIAPDNGYKMTIQTIAFNERRSLTGIRAYEVRFSNTPNFSTYTTLVNDSVPDDDLTRDGTISGLNIMVNNGDTVYIRWYGYKAEGGTGTWRIDANTLSIDGTTSQINPNNNDSYASEPDTQVSGDTITSVCTTFALAKHIFSFKINDAGTTDGLPTHISYIAVQNANTVDWSSILGGAFIKINNNNVVATDSIISHNAISFTFNSGVVDVPNGSSITVDVYVFLKPSPLTDNTPIKCYIDSSCFNAYISGSGFSPSFTPITSNTFYIDVVGSKLNITS